MQHHLNFRPRAATDITYVFNLWLIHHFLLYIVRLREGGSLFSPPWLRSWVKHTETINYRCRTVTRNFVRRNNHNELQCSLFFSSSKYSFKLCDYSNSLFCSDNAFQPSYDKLNRPQSKSFCRIFCNQTLVVNHYAQLNGFLIEIQLEKTCSKHHTRKFAAQCGCASNGCSSFQELRRIYRNKNT